MKYDYLIFLPFLICILYSIYSVYATSDTSKNSNTSIVEKLNHGRASKIEFSGHSYVVWQQNLSDCIVHDPDCKCFYKE